MITFHHRDGWYFTRLPDGSVQIEAPGRRFHTVPPAEWASIVAHVAGGTAASYTAATKLHFGVQSLPPDRPPAFTTATCRGSLLLGSACGNCERCSWEHDRLTQPPSAVTEGDC